MRRLFLLLAVLALATHTSAQEADYREDLRLVEALRARGDVDLALEQLKRLEATATPELKKELPLELAKTRLRLASEEPDTTKRLAMYRESMGDFQKFIAADPKHPRAPEASLDIARLLNAIGKAELSMAYLSEDDSKRQSLSKQGRDTLANAQKHLMTAEKMLTAAREKLPDPEAEPDAAKKKLARQAVARADAEILQATFERAMNLYEQAEAFRGVDNEASSKLLTKALDVLGPLSGGDLRAAATWKAKAWQGRILFDIQTPDAGRAKMMEVINSASTAAPEGRRIARYFLMQAISEKPGPEDTKWAGPTGKGVAARLIHEGESWRKLYPRHLKTPEGLGVTFLLAETLLKASADPKLAAATRDAHFARARALIRELEAGENEYTARARRMKIQAMAAQGLFKSPLAKLKAFDDFYLRAQYEAYQLTVDKAGELREKIKGLNADLAKATDPKEKKDLEAQIKAAEAGLARATDPKESEKAREGHIQTIKEALRKAFAAPDVKKAKGGLEYNNARAMLTYWALTSGELDEALKVGEEFIRDDPRSPQAAITAIYTLQACTQLLDSKRGNPKFEEKEVADLQARLLSLSRYIEERWPRENAGEMARHTVGLQLLKEEKFAEAIQRLGLISPGYGNYALVCFQISDACDRAYKAKADPIPGDEDVEGYRRRSVEALEKIPAAVLGPDPFLNKIAVAAKAKLGREWFRLKKYNEMKALCEGLLPRLNDLKFSDKDEEDKAVRNQLRYELTDVSLFAIYGLATAAFDKGGLKQAAEMLDPLVDILSKPDESPEKTSLQKNQQLAMAILSIALKAHLQQGNIDRTDLVLQSMDAVKGEGGGGVNTLQMLAGLIRLQVDEVRKKGDKAALDKAVQGFKALLKKRTEKAERTPELVRALASCFSSMEDHAAAAQELKELNKGPVNEKDPASKGARLMYIRALRLSKDPANIKEARKLIDEVMQPAPKKPGWGARDLSAIKEDGLLMHEEGQYARAFNVWMPLVKRLASEAPKGGAVRESYFEVYFYMVYSYYKNGMARPSQKDRDAVIVNAAKQIHSFEASWPDFGGGASQQRFTEFLAAEPALKAEYEKSKPKGKGK
jgi:hypothetical protein